MPAVVRCAVYEGGAVMAFPLVPLITAGASLIGGQLANSANAREARRNRDFQADMSGSAYQRAVRDMRLAGLNPALMYPGGGGASTPSGSKAEFSDVVSGAAASALQARRLREELLNMKASRELMEKEAKLKDTQELTEAARAENEWYRNKAMEVEIRGGKARAMLDEADLPYARRRAAIDSSRIGEIIQGFQYGFNSLLPAILQMGPRRR